MLLGILGIIVSIGCFLIPYIISSKEKTIRYWHVETESLFSNKIKEIPELKVIYKDKEINDDIIILKTVIENNGRKDIDESIVHEPMTIVFDDSLELLEVEVLKSQCNLEIEKSKNSIICKWDLLKKNEFIVLKVLLQNIQKTKTLDSHELLKKQSNIHFRITDLHKTKRINYTKAIPKKIDYTGLIIPIVFVLTSIFIITADLLKPSYKIQYSDVYFEGKPYTISSKDDNRLLLKCNKEKQLITLDDYNNKEQSTKLKIIPTKENYAIVISYGFMFIAGVFLLFVEINSIKKDKKIRCFFNENLQKKLEDVENKN